MGGMSAPVPKELTPNRFSFTSGHLHHALPAGAGRQSTKDCVAGPTWPIWSKNAIDHILTQIGAGAQGAEAVT
eukprot:944544-Lingulodinium_polyedra.AAC.1